MKGTKIVKIVNDNTLKSQLKRGSNSVYVNAMTFVSLDYGLPVVETQSENVARGPTFEARKYWNNILSGNRLKTAAVAHNVP